MKNITQSFKTIVLALVLALGVSYVSAAWTVPTLAPTGGNVASPLNTSVNDQSKGGTLTLSKTGAVQGFETYGKTLLATVSGNVGIGTTAPGQKLTVNGTIKASGDVCIDQAGGKCLSSLASLLDGYVEVYANAGEDIYGNTNQMPAFDTCNGDLNNFYTCTVSENRSCMDIFNNIFCVYSECWGEGRPVTCKAQKMLRK